MTTTLVSSGPGAIRVKRMTPYEKFRLAQWQFDRKDYRTAATTLEELLTDLAATDSGGSDGGILHGDTEARQLLTRAYYHSAQLGRAETAARALLEADPTDGYAALLLGHTLRRDGRHEEAQRTFARAAALGAPGAEDALAIELERAGSGATASDDA